MDQDPEQDPKLEARKAALELRRARLRDLADSVLESTEAMDKPETWLEAGRATRTIGAMDRVMIRLYSEPDLRCITAMERAARRAKLAPLPEMDDEPEEPSTPESLARKQNELADRITRFAKMQREERGLPLEGFIDKDTYLKADRALAERRGNGAHYKPPIWYYGDPWPKEWQDSDPQGDYRAEPEDNAAPPEPRPSRPPTDPALEEKAQAIFDAYLEAIKARPSTDSGARQDTGPP